ncbi:hypothetical protein RJ639_018520 [Escallonia herrerae]|uniref:PPM-type phosphatase domain-containing protein n=1 Tax=Escallonia herrerae TaxID=1293975 RepID=A0AA88V740_9ASTE|nr:hypothetical protein RJ639_018520 [Escallonia herrerae]
MAELSLAFGVLDFDLGLADPGYGFDGSFIAATVVAAVAGRDPLVVGCSMVFPWSTAICHIIDGDGSTCLYKGKSVAAVGLETGCYGGGGVSVVAEEGGAKEEALVVVVGQSVVVRSEVGGVVDGGVGGCRKGRFGAFIGILLVLVSSSTTHGQVTVACMKAYEEGSAPAIFRSPECPQWHLIDNQIADCQYATLQGYREYLKDRVTCDLNFNDTVSCGGKEASEMASKLFLDYFYLHAVFGAYNVSNFASSHLLSALDEESVRGILKEAVLRAIHDIEIEFTSEALKNNYYAGSTTTVALLLDGRILVASVGDSKALLCSNRSKGSSRTLYAEELTRDHHPDRADERARIKAADGFVWVRGVPRINGLLAVSRAICNLSLKRYDVIAEPEVLDWRAIESNDVFLVVASDDIFESLSMKVFAACWKRTRQHVHRHLHWPIELVMLFCLNSDTIPDRLLLFTRKLAGSTGNGQDRPAPDLALMAALGRILQQGTAAPDHDLIVVGTRWCFHGPPPFAALLTGMVSVPSPRAIRPEISPMAVLAMDVDLITWLRLTGFLGDTGATLLPLAKKKQYGGIVGPSGQRRRAVKLIFRIISEILMGGVKIALLLVGLLVCTIPHSDGLSCKTIYEQGGAPAVFDSPDCDNQIFLTRFPENQTVNCEFSTNQGRRRYQEDRIACNLDLQTPFIGNFWTIIIAKGKKLRLNTFAGDNGTENVRVGVVAVFDGHIGKEASEMASKLFLDYFYLHSVFGTYQTKRLLDEEEILISEFRSHAESDLESVEAIVPEMTSEEHQMVILKGALLRTIHDIDAAFTKARGIYVLSFNGSSIRLNKSDVITILPWFSLFSQEAFKKNLAAGSTAIVALLFDGRILASNVGDSKAFLCSSQTEAEGSDMSSLSAEELTRDHTANIVEERARIQATGAYIFDGDDVPLIMGHFPMTRAIGDIPLKRFGIIPVPEITEWRPLTVNDSYLVVSSDGIFESLTPQNVCDLLRDENVRGLGHHSQCLSSSVADCIVQRAFENGSMDNLSVVVVPLKSAGFSPAPYEN